MTTKTSLHLFLTLASTVAGRAVEAAADLCAAGSETAWNASTADWENLAFWDDGVVIPHSPAVPSPSMK